MKLTFLQGFAVVFAALLVSCAGSPPPPGGAGSTAPYSQTPDGFYRVKRGDTLHAIAFRFSLDWREIARLNGISSPYTIYPDQMLKLSENTLASSSPVTADQNGVLIATVPLPSETATRPLDTPVASTTSEATSETGTAAEPSKTMATETKAIPEPSAQGAATEDPAAAKPASEPASEPTSEAGRPAPAATTQTAPVQADAAPATPARNLPPPQMTVPTTATGDPARWMWPTDGRILSSFRADDAARKGIDIGGQKGQPVVATAPGTVVYSGSGLIGYGELIIIKHSDRMLSAYAHNSKRLVSEGQQVGAGSQIAEMGINDRNQALLHFEIRVNGSPQDPLKYLPRR